MIALWPGLQELGLRHRRRYRLDHHRLHLVSLLSGRIAASAGMPNPQIRFGEDLMSRVSYVMMNPDGREAMTKRRARGDRRA